MLSLVKEEEDKLQEKFKSKTVIKKDDLSGLFFAFLNRARFNYTLWDIIEFFLRCLCLRKLKKARKNMSYKKHYLF